MSSFNYYIFYCSIVIFYGIGLHSVTLAGTEKNENSGIVKTIITISLSTLLSWVLITQLLIPCGLVELYPIICVAIFTVITIFGEILIRITTQKSPSEFTLSILIVLLSVSESNTILQAFLFSLFFICSFYLILPFIYSVNKRIGFTNHRSIIKKNALLLLSLAVLMIAVNVENISWLNAGVLL